MTRRVRVTAQNRKTIDIERLVRLLIEQVRSMEAAKQDAKAPETTDRGAA